LPIYTELGLEDNAIEVVTTTTFLNHAARFKDYYAAPTYWAASIEQYYTTALAKEKVYETER
jgi:hypothetical protein